MQQLGKYQLGQLLGQGGMGAVYRSFHPVLNQPVAVKVMQNTLAADPQAQQRFLREAQVVAGLAHPNIVNIFDVDIQDGRPYIVMEYLDAGSLADRLQAGPLTLAAALQLAAPLADALEYAHQRGLVHRDLKPANVLLRPDGSPVLADFGLARPVQADSAAQITATGAVMGTLAYMAPEQFSGQPTDARADIYSFGVMLYEMLTGRLPFTGDSAQIMYGHLQQPPPSLRVARPDLPEAIEQLVQRMLSKDPAWRPQRMAEVASALRAITAGTAATGPTVQARPATNPTLAAQPGPTAARGLVLGLAAGGVVLVLAIVAAVLVVLPLRRSATNSTPTVIATVALPRATVAEFDPPATARPSPTSVPLAEVPAALLNAAQAVGPEPFSIGGVSVRKDTDTVWFFGEVRNDAKEARESVEVRVILRDNAKQEVGSKRGFVDQHYLKPGEVAPFSILFTKDDRTPPFTTYDFEVISKPADFQLGYSYRELTLSDVRAQRTDLGFIEVQGRVQNSGEQPTKFVQVSAIFYDAQGKVVGTSSGFAQTPNDDPLAAGATARFEISAVVFSAPPTRYRLFVEGSQIS
ncbi:MAG: protein kinase [Chloroflexi bacterium SZAS-1]|nr:protein kinase [Chloroflexi bacterium SZAS-1]